MVRYDGNGVFDSTFGENGFAQSNFSYYHSKTRGVLRDGAGRIVAWGNTFCCASPRLGLLARYRADGQPDATFAGGKVYVLNVENVVRVFEQLDGKLVVVGYTEAGVLALARYEVDCPPTPDVDGDGLGDACDLCIGPSLSHVNLSLSNTLVPTGDDRLSLRARIDAPGVGPLDIVASGLQLVIEDAQRVTVQSVLLPAGTVEANLFGNGWKARGRGFRYTNSGVFGGDRWVDGLTQFVVTANAHGEVRLRAKAKAGFFPVDPARLPLRATVVFSPPRSTTGQCAEIAFTPAQCQYQAAGGRVRCK